MIFSMTVDIADHQRALVFRRGRFEQVLLPGRYRLSLMRGKPLVELYDATALVMARSDIKYLMRDYPQLAEQLEHFETSDVQVGLVYRAGKLTDILAPSSEVTIWKGVDEIRVDLIDVEGQIEVPANMVARLGKALPAHLLRKAQDLLYYVDVPDRHVGLLQINGAVLKLLDAGSYAYWKVGRSIAVKAIDLRQQVTEVSGQEILTRDRVSLRVNLSASYQVVDAGLVAERLSDYSAYLYRRLQLVLREAVGTRSLDELLQDKDALNGEIRRDAVGSLREVGIELLDVGVKDIILPGDMKEILNQVVQAQKEAEANLIRRREETQAMRSLHNTAKMMENSPVLMRLKELEALERVTGKIDRISVYGGLDGLMNELVKLRGVTG